MRGCSLPVLLQVALIILLVVQHRFFEPDAGLSATGDAAGIPAAR
jgi:hypothetical protein